MRRKRVPFDQRIADPPGLQLTARDIAVVTAVHDHRFLQRDQIVQLFFPSVNTANYRLQRLFQHHYLQRVFAPTHYRRNARNTQAIYGLDEAGARLVAVERGLPRERIDWYPDRNRVGEFFLQHLLIINDVRIAVTRAAQARGDHIATWVPEWTLKAQRERVTDPATSRTYPVSPDAYFVYEEKGGRRSHFFLEVDRATMQNRRFAHKVKAYILYRQTGAYQQRYGTHSLRVLTVVPSARRLRNLKQTTEKVGGCSLFWFTTFDALATEQILQPVWKIAGQDAVAALLR